MTRQDLSLLGANPFLRCAGRGRPKGRDPPETQVTSPDLVFLAEIHVNDRTGIAAGSPIPEELMRQLIDKLNLKELTNAYGMSENNSTYVTSSSEPVCMQ